MKFTKLIKIAIVTIILFALSSCNSIKETDQIEETNLPSKEIATYTITPTPEVTTLTEINIQSVKELEKIKSLNYDGRKAPRNFDLGSVEEINIRNVSNFDFLKGMRNLKKITLDEDYVTSVSGDISILKNCEKLEYINLGGALLYGDIAALSELNDLKHLGLRSEDSQYRVNGDILSLSKLTKLEFLDIVGTKITGSIASISNLINLQYIDIGNSEISDLLGIQDLVNLKTIKIFFSDMSGDLEFFSHLKKLESLEIEFNYYLTGDLESIKGLTNLKVLNLVETDITGDIVSLSELELLTELRLNYNIVSGNIEALSNMKKLKILCMQMTNVNGDISSLSSLENLMIFRIYETEVEGSRNALKNLNNLIYSDIKGENIQPLSYEILGIAISTPKEEVVKILGKPNSLSKEYHDGIGADTIHYDYDFGSIDFYPIMKNAIDVYFVNSIVVDKEGYTGPEEIQVGDTLAEVIESFSFDREEILVGDIKKELFDVRYSSFYVEYESKNTVARIDLTFDDDYLHHLFIIFDNDKVIKFGLYTPLN